MPALFCKSAMSGCCGCASCCTSGFCGCAGASNLISWNAFSIYCFVTPAFTKNAFTSSESVGDPDV